MTRSVPCLLMIAIVSLVVTPCVIDGYSVTKTRSGVEQLTLSEDETFTTTLSLPPSRKNSSAGDIVFGNDDDDDDDDWTVTKTQHQKGAQTSPSNAGPDADWTVTLTEENRRNDTHTTNSSSNRTNSTNGTNTTNSTGSSTPQPQTPKVRRTHTRTHRVPRTVIRWTHTRTRQLPRAATLTMSISVDEFPAAHSSGNRKNVNVNGTSTDDNALDIGTIGIAAICVMSAVTLSVITVLVVCFVRRQQHRADGGENAAPMETKAVRVPNPIVTETPYGDKDDTVVVIVEETPEVHKKAPVPIVNGTEEAHYDTVNKNSN